MIYLRSFKSTSTFLKRIAQATYDRPSFIFTIVTYCRNGLSTSDLDDYICQSLSFLWLNIGSCALIHLAIVRFERSMCKRYMFDHRYLWSTTYSIVIVLFSTTTIVQVHVITLPSHKVYHFLPHVLNYLLTKIHCTCVCSIRVIDNTLYIVSQLKWLWLSVPQLRVSSKNISRYYFWHTKLKCCCISCFALIGEALHFQDYSTLNASI